VLIQSKSVLKFSIFDKFLNDNKRFMEFDCVWMRIIFETL